MHHFPVFLFSSMTVALQFIGLHHHGLVGIRFSQTPPIVGGD